MDGVYSKLPVTSNSCWHYLKKIMNRLLLITAWNGPTVTVAWNKPLRVEIPESEPRKKILWNGV
jgi:hypothetical protein